jgi:hypothetical protein
LRAVAAPFATDFAACSTELNASPAAFETAALASSAILLTVFTASSTTGFASFAVFAEVFFRNFLIESTKPIFYFSVICCEEIRA